MEGVRSGFTGMGAKGVNGSGKDAAVAACDLVAASRFRVVTRRRADRARRRRSNLSTTYAFSNLTAASNNQHVAPYSVAVAVAPPPPPPSSPKPPPFRLTPLYDIDRTNLRFLFRKILQKSDVSYLRRIILPKKAAEAHLPVLQIKEGIPIKIYDLDGRHIWTFKYRFWPNNSSRMYVFENAGDFVAAHGLQAGDCFIMYLDIVTQYLVIEAKKSEVSDERKVIIAAESEVKPIRSSAVVPDYILTPPAPEVANPPSDIFVNFPPREDSVSQFVYDTSSFCNESPLDFLGGSAINSSNHYFQSDDFINNLPFGDFHF
uniref:TF-B3 domain-containing protein n=1 Tax=Kalanchoe fedtschenkoi TaxID=63787 RepID=A0A7N0TQ97_KALFE